VHCHDKFVTHLTGHYVNSVRRFHCKSREIIDFNADGWEQFQHENSNDDGIRLVNVTAPVNAVAKGMCSRLEHKNTL
jgi:hypothetical protein